MSASSTPTADANAPAVDYSKVVSALRGLTRVFVLGGFCLIAAAIVTTAVGEILEEDQTDGGEADETETQVG